MRPYRPPRDTLKKTQAFRWGLLAPNSSPNSVLLPLPLQILDYRSWRESLAMEVRGSGGRGVKSRGLPRITQRNFRGRMAEWRMK